MFRGSMVALATPFKSNQEVDFDAYGRLVDFQLENGTDGIVPCGCTGEAATLSHDEQKQCIRFVIERVAGRVPVIAGTGSNNTKEAVSLTQYAKEVGADGALLITPYYNKPPQRGIVAHFEAIARSSDKPIVVYNIPARVVLNLEPSTIALLGEIENVTAVKQANDDAEQARAIVELGLGQQPPDRFLKRARIDHQLVLQKADGVAFRHREPVEFDVARGPGHLSGDDVKGGRIHRLRVIIKRSVLVQSQQRGDPLRDGPRWHNSNLFVAHLSRLLSCHQDVLVVGQDDHLVRRCAVHRIEDLCGTGIHRLPAFHNRRRAKAVEDIGHPLAG